MGFCLGQCFRAHNPLGLGDCAGDTHRLSFKARKTHPNGDASLGRNMDFILCLFYSRNGVIGRPHTRQRLATEYYIVLNRNTSQHPRNLKRSLTRIRNEYGYRWQNLSQTAEQLPTIRNVYVQTC